MISFNDLRVNEAPKALRHLALAGQREADISAAASQLAKLGQEARNRPPRKFTGRIGSRRAWVGMPVVLPDGRVGHVVVAKRGAAIVHWADDFAIRRDQFGACETRELRSIQTASGDPFRINEKRRGREAEQAESRSRPAERQPPGATGIEAEGATAKDQAVVVALDGNGVFPAADTLPWSKGGVLSKGPKVSSSRITACQTA